VTDVEPTPLAFQTLGEAPDRFEAERLISLLVHENSYLRARLDGKEPPPLDPVADDLAHQLKVAREYLARAETDLAEARRAKTEIEERMKDSKAAERDLLRILTRLRRTPVRPFLRLRRGYRVIESRWLEDTR
jgi:hypothetical protein